jgi:hypothetical protein
LAHEEVTQSAMITILKERLRPFDLTIGPLIRTLLLQLTNHENLLLITGHHIIVDHWSMQILRSECVVLYEAYSQGRRSPLPDPAIQFADYACWEKEMLYSGSFKRYQEFWKSHLADSMPGSVDQEARNGIGTRCDLFNQVSIEIGEELFAKIKRLAIEQSCTIFVLLVSAIVANFHRLRGDQTLRIGIIVANRRQETERIIGHFINTVIIRLTLRREATFKDLLDQVRAATLVAYSQQEFPIEQVMRDLESEKDFDRASLFQVLINYQKRDSKPTHVTGLTFAPWDFTFPSFYAEAPPTAFNLIFNMKETLTNLKGTVSVRNGNADDRNAEGLSNKLTRILESMVSDSNRMILTCSEILGVKT